MLRIPLPSATHSGAYIPEDDGFALCTVRGGEGHTHSRLYACTAREEAKRLLRGLPLSIALLSIWGASLLPIDSFLSIPTCTASHAWFSPLGDFGSGVSPHKSVSLYKSVSPTKKITALGTGGDEGFEEGGHAGFGGFGFCQYLFMDEW